MSSSGIDYNWLAQERKRVKVRFNKIKVMEGDEDCFCKFFNIEDHVRGKIYRAKNTHISILDLVEL